jgi:hypothetical protein
VPEEAAQVAEAVPKQAEPQLIAPPTMEQIAVYLQSQKMLKMQRKQLKVQQLTANAF